MRPYLILAFSLILVTIYISSPHAIPQNVEAQMSAEELRARSCEASRQWLEVWSDSPAAAWERQIVENHIALYCNAQSPDQPPPRCQAPQAGTPTTTSRMEVSENLLNFLERHEGNNHSPNIRRECAPAVRINCHATADRYGLYQDSAGHCTGGIGHLVHRGPCTQQDIQNYRNSHPNGMSRDDARAQLRNDVTAARNAVRTNIGVDLTQEQFDALVSFTFNVGAGSFRNSGLLRDINAGRCDPETITNDFNQWRRAGNNPDALGPRRTSEINIFNNGQYR